MSLQKYVQQLKSIKQNQVSEAYNIFPKSEKDIDNLKNDISIQDTEKLKSLFTAVRKKSGSMTDPIALDPKKQEVKIARDVATKLDLPSLKKEFGISVTAGDGSGRKGSKKGPSGAEWENVITSRYNKKIGKPNADNDANEVSDEFPDTHNIGDTIADNLIKLGLKGAMTQFGGGKSKANLSDFWLDNGGKDGTPKTDMYSKDFNISLKKKGGSQLASGMTGETIATFNAALAYMGTDRKSQKKINEIMTMVEDNFTKLKTDYTIGAIRKLEKKKDSLTPADKKVVSEYSETDTFHKELNKKVVENLGFEDNKEFLQFYIYECLSGFKKFNDSKSVARASVCVEFDADTGSVSKFYKITSDGKKDGLSQIPSISKDVASIASKAKLYAAWKTPKTGPHSSFRVGLTNSYQEIQELPTLRTLVRNEIMNDKIANAVLKEDIHQLDEFAIIRRTVNKLKQIGRSAKMWTTNLISKIAKKVKKTLNTIKKMGSRVFEGLFKFLGIELKSVKQSLPKDVEEFAFGQDA